MALYALIYEVVDGYAEKRMPVRPDHFAHIRAAEERGELLLGGALGDPLDGALLVFQTDDPATVEAFAAADPYVLAGLVTRWTVRPWHVVLGEQRLDVSREP